MYIVSPADKFLNSTGIDSITQLSGLFLYQFLCNEQRCINNTLNIYLQQRFHYILILHMQINSNM